jgi:hypothetical protein
MFIGVIDRRNSYALSQNEQPQVGCSDLFTDEPAGLFNGMMLHTTRLQIEQVIFLMGQCSFWVTLS